MSLSFSLKICASIIKNIIHMTKRVNKGRDKKWRWSRRRGNRWEGSITNIMNNDLYFPPLKSPPVPSLSVPAPLLVCPMIESCLSLYWPILSYVWYFSHAIQLTSKLTSRLLIDRSSDLRPWWCIPWCVWLATVKQWRELQVVGSFFARKSAAWNWQQRTLLAYAFV